MMGYEGLPQDKLFYIGITLDKKVRKNHPLRKINKAIDFDFIYREVKNKYGSNGNVSTPPPVILKLILLLTLYNVRSERELMDTVPERIDWLWFLGYDLETEIPDHSVLSKARKKWGAEVFKSFFERIVWQCVEAGLVDGSKLFMDSSLVDADASNNSVVDTHSLKRYLNKSYQELERRLEGREEASECTTEKEGIINNRYISTTDPEAAIMRQGGRPKLQYKTDRAVDSAGEIITAVEVTSGAVNEAHRLTALMDQHQDNTGRRTETVVADSKYGTVENFLACNDRGVKAHMPDLKQRQDKGDRRRGIYGEENFYYEQATDTYLCPAGIRLKRKSLHEDRQNVDYGAPRRECAKCTQRESCTRNKSGRTLKRHLRQNDLNLMRANTRSAAAKRDIRTRQHLMERSFARSKRYGYDRSRWRGLWRAQIQEYMTAAIQNIQVLILHGKSPCGKAVAVKMVDSARNLIATGLNMLKKFKSEMSLEKYSCNETTGVLC